MNIDLYYNQKKESLHGLAEDYAENEGVGYVPYQILFSELLSLSHAMEYLYGEEGKNFLWGTVKAYTVLPPQENVPPQQKTSTTLPVGEYLHTLGAILTPVYSYLEESGGVKVAKLSRHVLNEPLPNKEETSALHLMPDWNSTAAERAEKIYHVHASLDEDDEWGAIGHMYQADVLGFQLWLIKYSELITETQTRHLQEDDAVSTKTVGGMFNLGSDDLGQIFYDIMWDLTLKALQDLGEISHADLESAMELWRSRFIWIAGPENAETVLEFLNNHIPEKA